jgi:hypothetical protein
MIKVAGVWELGWNTPIKEIELWEYPLRDFGVDELHMSPVSGISSLFVHEHSNLGPWIDQERVNGNTIVFVDENGVTDLDDFEHPENAVYVLGKASLSAMVAYGLEQDLSVKIKTKMNAGLLWPHQAITIVLNDRFKKEGNI